MTATKRTGASIAEKVRNYLAEKPPLTSIDLDELYRSTTTTNKERDACRSALYRFSIGTPVSAANRTKVFYAVRFTLVIEDQNYDIFLSLPGIPLDYLERDAGTTKEIENIIQRLKEKYGEAAIDYWCRSGQYRTVDFAKEGMKRATGRDKAMCQLCKIANPIRQSKGMQKIQSKAIRASHIISRKTIFWLLVDKIDREGCNIFSNEGAKRIMQGLKDDPYHNDPNFIIALCADHDKALLDAIRQAAKD